MALNMSEMWFNGIKIAFFFQKITKIRPEAWGFAPRPPKLPAAGGPAPRPLSVLRLSYFGCLKTSPRLPIRTFQLY